jgi:hypothetical protein
MRPRGGALAPGAAGRSGERGRVLDRHGRHRDARPGARRQPERVLRHPADVRRADRVRGRSAHPALPRQGLEPLRGPPHVHLHAGGGCPVPQRPADRRRRRGLLVRAPPRSEDRVRGRGLPLRHRGRRRVPAGRGGPRARPQRRRAEPDRGDAHRAVSAVPRTARHAIHEDRSARGGGAPGLRAPPDRLGRVPLPRVGAEERARADGQRNLLPGASPPRSRLPARPSARPRDGGAARGQHRLRSAPRSP